MTTTEIIIASAVLYVFLAATVAKLGSYRKCGGKKAFFVSLFLTPITGIIYVLSSPLKSVIKIVRYRCNHCSLDFTTYQRYCPNCRKDGEHHRLHRIVMKAH